MTYEIFKSKIQDLDLIVHDVLKSSRYREILEAYLAIQELCMRYPNIVKYYKFMLQARTGFEDVNKDDLPFVAALCFLYEETYIPLLHLWDIKGFVPREDFFDFLDFYYPKKEDAKMFKKYIQQFQTEFWSEDAV